MTGVLSPAQVAHFEDEGYLCPVRAISADEAQLYRRRIEDFEQKTGEEVNKRLKIKAHLAFPWLVDLARHPRIVSAVQDIIGPDVLLFGCSAFAKNARDPRFVSWHQDSAYYGLDPHEEVTVWLALSRANALSGCMKVIPRSHRGPDLVHEETYDTHNLLARGQKVTVDESLAVEMPLEPGEFSMHHERTVHGSPANMSDDRRIGIAFFYMPAHARSTLGRRSALLVAGEDRHGHWDKDPEPKFDLDPDSLAFMESVWATYRDEATTRQSARIA
ncbi:phytanoyl-CoA dioxygenase family protein [Xanthobacter oligotrophicus]|uniref:phytanoyl-CoA dioxygenase family protein n=1 Tax=Xanthobacter oligotrophicus TaxID=2607286 RepID=UPI0011F1FC3B|nr:phytanoyl-CoA dioxygenase family protein [Xanthobacter oligotrophicus]MCG5237907.1 phytanoyl-CoA dioxygenase family protein [Xanthobacter oligotrophicus]